MIILLVAIGFMIYFFTIGMYGAAVGAAIVAGMIIMFYKGAL